MHNFGDRNRISWCACGLSKKQPMCDGSHRGSGLSPMRVKGDGSSVVFLCGCKQTKTAPYCDGSHMAEAIQNCSIG